MNSKVMSAMKYAAGMTTSAVVKYTPKPKGTVILKAAIRKKFKTAWGSRRMDALPVRKGSLAPASASLSL